MGSSSSAEYIYTLYEAAIACGEGFCAAGSCVSAVFVGGRPPPNTPNMRVDWYE
ncbi:hypothetical protein M9Y10_025264 [Tritrichomonas musculus]|uniref:Uncharacterized protein n=1 Tax=Tritrichomonas musculus TaxID=1915356 RepID=A0ABR2HA12_9EUKA